MEPSEAAGYELTEVRSCVKRKAILIDIYSILSCTDWKENSIALLYSKEFRDSGKPVLRGTKMLTDQISYY